MISARQLLKWIAEESRERMTIGERPIVPIRVIMSRQSIETEGGRDLTMSTVLSLKSFDRASLVRMLRDLVDQELLYYLDDDLNPRDVNDPQFGLAEKLNKDKGLGFVALTEKGVLQSKNVFQRREEDELVEEELTDDSEGDQTNSENTESDNTKTENKEQAPTVEPERKEET